jgi:hypothetical protein
LRVGVAPVGDAGGGPALYRRYHDAGWTAGERLDPRA